MVRTSYRTSPLREKLKLVTKPSKKSIAHNDSLVMLHEIDERKETEAHRDKIRVLKRELSKELEKSHSQVKLDNIRRIKKEDLLTKKILLVKKSRFDDSTNNSRHSSHSKTARINNPYLRSNVRASRKKETLL